MTYTISNEKNYAAECIKAPEQLIEFDNLQNLKGIFWAGYTILVPNEYAGRELVVFPAESQLSETLAHENNLYAKQELNSDPEVDTGYLGNNRRVRAIKLRGVPSSALALPAELFGNPPVGTVFDTVDGVEVCRKYVIPRKPGSGTQGKSRVEKLWRRVDDKYLPMHYDTGQWWRESEKMDPNRHMVITQKVHGTSVRISKTYVKRKLNWFERLMKWAGVPVQEMYIDLIGGSRKVIKDPKIESQNHFYKDDEGKGLDIWTHAAKRYGDLIPDGVILYGELIGYVPGTQSPIQKGYTYDLRPGEYELYVYRVAVVTPDGGLYDLSWDGVREFCDARGLKHVPELERCYPWEFQPENWVDHRYYDLYVNHPHKYRDKPVPLCSESPVDEGVVCLQEGVIPFALKAKGEIFYNYETEILDAVDKGGDVDELFE